MEPSPACNLSAADYRERLAWIDELNSTALRDYRRGSRQIELSYAPSAMDVVREFVRRERECCPLLDFSLRESRDTVTLLIAVSADLSRAADDLFAPYIGS